MKSVKVLLAACMLSGALAACADSSAHLTAPDRARRNGSGLGSGNLADTTTSTTTTFSTETVAGDSTSIGRGGHGFGSGH